MPHPPPNSGELDVRRIRKELLRWFARHQRELPWRQTRDPYAIWISEIMLQQTRVVAVIPYYERFLHRFPRVDDLAAAPEEEVLRMWAGLGYYSRARNLQKAAQQVVAQGGFPRDYEGLRGLAGVGDYTAAAVVSIAFGRPHAAVDGNVRRVVTRLAGDADVDVAKVAGALLDGKRPGDWNQAVMELGATICLPRAPLCLTCPVQGACGAFAHGLQEQLPPVRKKAKLERRERTLVVIRKAGQILLVPSPRVEGFWDLPEPADGMTLGAVLGSFRHGITTSLYIFEVREGRTSKLPKSGRWWDEKLLYQIPLGTASKKALACLKEV